MTEDERRQIEIEASLPGWPKPRLRQVSLSQLNNSDAITERHKRLSFEYADKLRRGEEPPPIVVTECGDGVQFIFDGHCRVLAAKEVGHERIEALVYREVQQAAVAE